MGPNVPANNGPAVDSNQYKLRNRVSPVAKRYHAQRLLRVSKISIGFLRLLLIIFPDFGLLSTEGRVQLVGGLPDGFGSAGVIHCYRRMWRDSWLLPLTMVMSGRVL